MMERCAELDEFFNGEVGADQADRFHDYLATCERSQDVLLGRMQESVAAGGHLARAAPATSPFVATPGPLRRM
jgi:hypothetical protein